MPDRDRAARWKHPFADVDDDLPSSSLKVALRRGVHDDDPLLVAGIEAEHRSLRRSRVPHVLPLHRVERGREGRIVLVYRSVHGQSLGTILEGGGLPLRRAAVILRQLFRAISGAHGARLDHRALGAASVLVGDDDSVYVMDFGVATIVEGQSDSGCAQLHPMTPEAVFGGGTEASEDVYLLGCLAYRMLTGHPPFPCDGLATLRRRHAIEDPQPPSEVGDRPIPAGIEAVVLRALEKVPDDRWPDVRAFEQAFVAAQREAGVSTVFDETPWLADSAESAEGRRDVQVLARVPLARRAAKRPARAVPAPAPVPARARARPVSTRWLFRIGLAGLTAIAVAGGLLLGALDRPAAEVRSAGLASHLAFGATSVGRPGIQLARIRSAPAAPDVVAYATRASNAIQADTEVIHAFGSAGEASLDQPRWHSEACARVRRRAIDARNAHDWQGLLRASAQPCWHAVRSRVRLRVKALLELQRFSDCVALGPELDQPDPEARAWLTVCARRARSGSES